MKCVQVAYRLARLLRNRRCPDQYRKRDLGGEVCDHRQVTNTCGNVWFN